MIRLTKLTKRYGAFTAVNAIDLAVPRGQLFGFLGPNGAGKTTTLRMIAGILRPTAGTVQIAGIDISKDPIAAKARLGFIPDRPFIYEKLTGAEFLRFVAGLYEQKGSQVEHRARELLALFDLEDWRDELVESYSHGMRQKLIISSAFVHRPEVIVVDEPMVGLDPKAVRTLKELFREYTRRGNTIMMSTHTLAVAEALCDRVAIIQQGEIRASGTIAELQSAAATGVQGLEDIFLRLTGETTARALAEVLDAKRAGDALRPNPNLAARHRALSGEGPAVGRAGYTPAGGRIVPSPSARPSILSLLSPKWLSARARLRGRERGRGMRTALLATVGAMFWMFSFGVLYRLLVYFRSVEEIGALLAGKLLGLILVGFFSILLLSNVITALSSFFLARDLDLLIAAPVDWLTLYGAKLVETTLHSSWMVALLAFPLFAAYGVAYSGGVGFVLVALATFIPFLLIPAAVGSALTLILVNVFPARRTRDLLGVIAVLAAAALVLMFRLVRPERLARPEGFRSLVDFIALLRGPTSPFLPSDWTQRAIMRWLTGSVNGEVFPLEMLPIYLLWSTAAALIVVGALIHRVYYAKGFTKAQESGERWARAGALQRIGNTLLGPLGTLRRELVLKELRVFFRDSTQWSQLILLAVLVVVYVFNIKFLPLTGEGITFFIVNLVPFLNLALAGFVLASVAARFIFPAVSLEGRTWWLLRSSPMSLRELLWAKYWVGTLPLLVLALAIVGVTNTLLKVSPFMFAVSVLTVTLLTFAIGGLALGFGALFPQFETENAAQIPTSFGGLLFMMSAIGLIGAVIMLEARPVWAYLGSKSLGGAASALDLWPGFVGAAAVCLLSTFIPIRMALAKLEAVER